MGIGVTMPELHIRRTTGEVAQAAAEFVARLAEECQSARNRFTIALSGTSTPLPLYGLPASSPWADRIAWDRRRIFWGDERCVPPDHQDSNYRMAKEAMLDHLSMPPGQVHRMRGEVEPQAAAEEYEAVVRDVFQTPVPSFDLILLGIGDDGHTASLFYGTAALEKKNRLVVANQVRLELFVLAYNLGNFMRRLALPEAMKHWSLSSLQTKPIPRWDVHFGILKTTEETQRLVISPLVATRVGTDSVVLRYVHFTLALV